MPGAAEAGNNVVGFLDDRHDFGMAGQAGGEGVNIESAEACAKVEMLLGRDVLVAEKDHDVFVESLANFGKSPVVQGAGQIDPEYLGTKRARYRLHIDILVVHDCLLGIG